MTAFLIDIAGRKSEVVLIAIGGPILVVSSVVVLLAVVIGAIEVGVLLGGENFMRVLTAVLLVVVNVCVEATGESTGATTREAISELLGTVSTVVPSEVVLGKTVFPVVVVSGLLAALVDVLA